MRIPQRLSAGVEIATIRQWLNDLRDSVAANVARGDEKTIKVNQTANGTTISAMRRTATKGDEGGDTDTYEGYWSASQSGNDITVSAGKIKAGNTFADVAEATVTATAAGFIICTITYSGGYLGTVSFVADLTSLADGNDVIVLHVVSWADAAVTGVVRQIAGVAMATGKIV